jgi:hypothetical protein
MTFLPPVVRWLWPTIIGIPAISFWIASHKRQDHARRAAMRESQSMAA